MNFKNKFFFHIVLISLISCSEVNDQPNDTFSSTIWNGSIITFEKSDGSDPTAAANQDRLTSNVWITRGNNGGQIYNIAKENTSDKNNSPIGTAWAIGTLDQVESLSFNKFRIAVGSPKDVVGKDLVLHLIEDDIYLSVKFSSWSTGKEGGFAYQRSTSN